MLQNPIHGDVNDSISTVKEFVFLFVSVSDFSWFLAVADFQYLIFSSILYLCLYSKCNEFGLHDIIVVNCSWLFYRIRPET